MKKRNDGDALLAVIHAVKLFHAGTRHVVAQTLIHIDAVLHQTARMRAVVTGAGGSGKEIAVLQKFQQLVSALALDLGAIDLNKLFLVVERCHNGSFLNLKIRPYFTTKLRKCKEKNDFIRNFSKPLDFLFEV